MEDFDKFKKLSADELFYSDDEEAVQLFNQYVEQYEMLLEQAEQSGMALTQMEAAAGGSYTWLQEPWPWDMETEA